MASITHMSTRDPSLAERYLADQLSEEERQTFEERLVSDPVVLREVEATARFKVGLAHLRETGELAALLEPQRSRAPYFAVAAAVALLAVGISLLHPGSGTVGPWIAASLQSLGDQHSTVLHAGQQYTLLRVRSQGQSDVVIALQRERQAVELRVLPDSGDPLSRYRVTLSRLDRDSREAGSTAIAGLIPDGGGYIRLFVDSAGLQAGRYQLAVQDVGSKDAADAGTFLIEVQAAGAGP